MTVTLAIQVLIAHGHDPKESMTFVSAYAYQPSGKSVTGRAQVLTHGSAHYDYNTDKVVFEPFKE